MRNVVRHLSSQSPSSSSSIAAIALVVLGAALCSGCNSTGVGNPPLTDEEQALAIDGNDSNAAGDTASAIISIPLLAIVNKTDIATPDGAATVARNVDAYLGRCVTAADRVGNVVTYRLNECTGPLGAVRASGTLIATYTVGAAGSLEVDVVSEGLSLNRRPVSETGHATVTFTTETTKQILWTGKFDGLVHRRGVHHEAAYTLAIDTSDPLSTCVSLDGSGTTTLDLGSPVEHGVTTTISGYVRCGGRGACADTGTIDVVNLAPSPKVKSVRVIFLGGAEVAVTVTRPEGKRTFTLPLSCDPEL